MGMEGNAFNWGLRRQRKIDLWIWSQPSLQRGFQNSQDPILKIEKEKKEGRKERENKQKKNFLQYTSFFSEDKLHFWSVNNSDMINNNNTRRNLNQHKISIAPAKT